MLGRGQGFPKVFEETLTTALNYPPSVPTPLTDSIEARMCFPSLGSPPVVPFYPFLGGRVPLQIQKKVGTLTMPSDMEVEQKAAPKTRGHDCPLSWREQLCVSRRPNPKNKGGFNVGGI